VVKKFTLESLSYKPQTKPHHKYLNNYEDFIVIATGKTLFEKVSK